MAYVALAFGILFIVAALTGKVLPMKRPSLFEIPASVNRVIYAWIGVVFTAAGILLVIRGRKS